jgi:hypothetical protein
MGQVLRTEGDVAPETWAEYAAWKRTKRMDHRDRQVVLAFAVIDYDLRDALDEEIHAAYAAATTLIDTVMSNPTELLLAKTSKTNITGYVGDLLFSLTFIFDVLAENWGHGQLVAARHFASKEDLASVLALHAKVQQTTGSPTEIVASWRQKLLMTLVRLSICIGQLSAHYRIFRWDTESLDTEIEATNFAPALECLEIAAAFMGLSLQQCMAVNQAKLNSKYPQGWRAADSQPAE